MPKKGNVKERIIDGEWIAEERAPDVYKVTRMNNSGEFTLQRETAQRWRISVVVDGKQRRPKAYGGSIAEALHNAIERVNGNLDPGEEPVRFRVSEVYRRWLDRKRRDDKTNREYETYIDLFLVWLGRCFPNVRYYDQLRLEHLERYAAWLGSEERENVEGRNKRPLKKLGSKDSFRLYTYPMRSCSEWASINWDGEYRDFAKKFEIPDAETEEKTISFIPLDRFPDLVVFARSQDFPSDLIAAFCLQGVLGMRLTEVLRLEWEQHIDLVHQVIVYKPKGKNRYARRNIPMPEFVHSVLSSVPEPTGKLVQSSRTFREYSRRVRKLFARWDRTLSDFVTKDLRNTLITTAYRQRWGGTLLERFVGHKGSVDELRRRSMDRDISMQHYFGNDLEFLLEEYRREVVPRIESNLGGPDVLLDRSTKIALPAKRAQVVQLRSGS
jgi:integrase